MNNLARKRQFLQTFGCCLSGRIDCDLAHLHEQHLTSLNQKVGDALTLPLDRLLHNAQHKHGDFWHRALGKDPGPWAIRLDERYKADDLDGADRLLRDMRDLARRDYLMQFLG